jgi:hypothetical protein
MDIVVPSEIKSFGGGGKPDIIYPCLSDRIDQPPGKKGIDRSWKDGWNDCLIVMRTGE